MTNACKRITPALLPEINLLFFSDVNFTDCEEWGGDGVSRGMGRDLISLAVEVTSVRSAQFCVCTSSSWTVQIIASYFLE